MGVVTLVGGTGDDRLEGGASGDILTGDAGRDTFVLAVESLAEAALTAPVYDRVTDFETGVTGDIIDLADLHAANLAEGYGDLWSGTEFAYAHGYIYFVQVGDDTHVMYDRDGLNGEYGGKIVAVLENTIADDVLPGINSNPPLSTNLFLIESENLAAGLSEDGGSTITYRIVLGQAPTAPVTVTVQGGDQISVGGGNEVTLTFTADNWWIPQEVTITASDDLLIEGNVPAEIVHSFSSADGDFEGLSETHSVTVIDNDFQRTLEPDKLPSEGNNYVIYDSFSGPLETSSGVYDLGGGGDLLEVSSDLWTDSGTLGRLFRGGSGNDTLTGVTQADGGTGNDTITSAANSGNRVTVQRYQSSYGSSTYDTTFRVQILSGGLGDDVINAANALGDVDIAGGSGSDTITGSSQDDVIFGDGYDVAERRSYDGTVLSASQATNYYGSRVQNQTEAEAAFALARAAGFNFSSSVSDGDSGNDTIDAGAGDDIVYGGSGADSISGGDGIDTLYGEDGNDIIDGGNDDDTIYGGLGDDEIRGGQGDDELRGDAGADTIYGEQGDDTLYGGADNDILYGGEGSDTLFGNEGDDTLYGAEENDTLRGNEGNDTLYGEGGADSLYGDAGADTLRGGEGDDVLEGGADDDTLYGDAGADILRGGSGTNTLYGGADDDTLYGDVGVDTLVGGTGDDRLEGGASGDILTGDDGRDTFVVAVESLAEAALTTPVYDRVTDFETGETGDVIDLAALHAANLGEGYGDLWSGTEFAYAHGYIRFEQVGDDTHVIYDRDGLNGEYDGKIIAVLENTIARMFCLAPTLTPFEH